MEKNETAHHPLFSFNKNVMFLYNIYLIEVQQS